MEQVEQAFAPPDRHNSLDGRRDDFATMVKRKEEGNEHRRDDGEERKEKERAERGYGFQSTLAEQFKKVLISFEKIYEFQRK